MQWLSCFYNVSVNISDTSILIIKNFNYHCIIHNVSKSEAISSLENSVLENCRCI